MSRWLPPRWLRQHEYVEKLNMHGILSASAGQEQLLTELLVSHAKVSLPGCRSDPRAGPQPPAGLALWAVCAILE